MREKLLRRALRLIHNPRSSQHHVLCEIVHDRYTFSTFSISPSAINGHTQASTAFSLGLVCRPPAYLSAMEGKPGVERAAYVSIDPRFSLSCHSIIKVPSFLTVEVKIRIRW